MYQKENDDFLKVILNERFFKPWSLPDYDSYKSLTTVSRLEIFITSSCNQKCEYCYLNRHEDLLYPVSIRNQELILNNLKLLLEYLIEKNFDIYSVDLFSGEIWHTEFGLQVLDTIYDYLLKGLKIKEFIIPSNCSFVQDKSYFFKIQKRIDNFKKLNSYLLFSVSIDGKYAEDISRPEKEKRRKDDFYDNIFAFAAHNHFCFHPMVSACAIEKQKENYLWFKEECFKHHINFYNAVMFLEVRNDDWTEEKIESYCNFLRFYLDDVISSLPENKIENFVKDLLGEEDFNLGKHYVPYGVFLGERNTVSCSITDTLTIRLGDLSICPCHRLAYKDYLYGKFIIEDNKIVDIKSNNIYMANRILLMNNDLGHPKCDTCIYNDYCAKGCFGSQLEIEKDPFMPIDSVCNLFKAKIKTVVQYYKEKGILEELKKIPNYNANYINIQKFLLFAEKIKG